MRWRHERVGDRSGEGFGLSVGGAAPNQRFLLILVHVDLSSWVEWVGKQQTGDGKAWAAERWPSLRQR